MTQQSANQNEEGGVFMEKAPLNKKALVGILAAVVLLAAAAVIPVSGDVTREGLYSLAIFFSAIIMWICDSLPMCVTSFILIFIMPLFGVTDLNSVFSGFGGSAFFFAIATFAVSIALEKTSVPLRICYALTKWSKGNPKKLVIAMLFACAVTSAIMSNLSTTIIYLSLSLALLRANRCEPLKSNLGRCLMIGIPAAAGCGGLITPAGTPGNLLIMDLLATQGIHLSFLQWIILFAPLSLITILICGLWATAIFKPETIGENAIKTLNDKLRESGQLKSDEKKTIAIIFVMLVCWFLGTWISVLNVTLVAVAGMTALFFPGVQVVTWDEIAKKTNWNLVFTIGAVGVLIGGMTATGIMDYMVNTLFTSISSWNVIAMFLTIGFVVCVIRAFIPTAPAIVALFGAPLLSVAALTGLSPVPLLMIPAYWACCPMLLWIEPIFLFSFGYGYYKPQDVLKYGSLPSVIMVMLMAFAPLYTNLLGL